MASIAARSTLFGAPREAGQADQTAGGEGQGEAGPGERAG
jgi:hypothetical protein